jgi:hypothetical protein
MIFTIDAIKLRSNIVAISILLNKLIFFNINLLMNYLNKWKYSY